MSEQNSGKLNLLLSSLGDTDLVSSRWLNTHGYSNSLIARYSAGGWLVSPSRGVYMRRGGRLMWDGVVRSLQGREGLPVHVGGRFALAMQGHEHYLRLGQAATVSVYGVQRLPGWVGKLPMDERIVLMGRGGFNLSEASMAQACDKTLLALGLMRYEVGAGMVPLVTSTPERAMLELCSGITDAAGVYEADALIQAMTTLRPQRVASMLHLCESIKAKRLFLALAERHGHAWFSRVPMAGVVLGRGKRVLVRGGRLNPAYLITLPGDLDEHLG